MLFLPKIVIKMFDEKRDTSIGKYLAHKLKLGFLYCIYGCRWILNSDHRGMKEIIWNLNKLSKFNWEGLHDQDLLILHRLEICKS